MSSSVKRQTSIRSLMPCPTKPLILSVLFVGLLPLLCAAYSLTLTCSPFCTVDLEDDSVRLVATVRNDNGDLFSAGTVVWEITQGSGALGDYGYPNGSGNGEGQWSAYYVPNSALEQTHKIKATHIFGGVSTCSDTVNVTVRRPIKIELTLDPQGQSINEKTEITARVLDAIEPSKHVTGEVYFSTDAGAGNGEFTNNHDTITYCYQSSSYSGCSVDYMPLTGDPDSHQITASFNGNDDYSWSSTTTALRVLKRLVEVSCDCTDATTLDTTHTCTIAVEDNHPDGDPITPVGSVENELHETLCTLTEDSEGIASGTFTVDTSVEGPVLIAPYYPGDDSHYPMIAEPQVIGGDIGDLDIVPVGALWDAYTKACWSLDLVSDITSEVGSIVCAWIDAADITDIAGAICSTIVSASVLALNTISQSICIDWDGDGIYRVIEHEYCGGTGMSDENDDSDMDGLADGEELLWAGWFLEKSAAPGELLYCPSPIHWDSDGDGLGDGEELFDFQTDYCRDDTDEDGVSDCDEVQTFHGVTARTLTADHADPLVQDSDGDGLSDLLEFDPGRLAVDTSSLPYDPGTAPTGYSPFVNDSDSDDDGLQDGIEDANLNVTWDGTVGGTGSTGTGETHLCLADTDADGLTDGEEEALFGPGPQTVHSTLGTITTPALDDDSDDDGLSDYEEQVVTQTDPLHWDSDGDGLSDADELIVIGGEFPTRSFDQASNPRSSDTDGDGLADGIEYPGTGVVRTTSTSGGTRDVACPYVNDNDSDDDGIQDGVENWDGDGDDDFPATLGETGTQASLDWETDPCNGDSDCDGLSDGEECGLLGGLRVDPDAWHDLGVTPFEYVTAVVDTAGATVQTIPVLDDDCDDDGLSDYEEVNVTGTDPLDADSDDDGLLDSCELIVTGGTFPLRSFYQESDPLDPDTDDDEIRDDVEYNDGDGSGVGRASTSGSPDTSCPYVNDPDSDDDGLQDGIEDANHDGTWGDKNAGITIGTFDTAASRSVDYWETDPCNPDTDGDGLSDGLEVSLLGGGPLAGQSPPGFETVSPEGVSTDLPLGTGPAGSPPGTGNNQLGPYTFAPKAGGSIAATVPALDVDSDNDGLSDFEEVNITGTDPLDQDTDNDTLNDADELVATGGVPGATPNRTFDQESDPLDINSDDDFLFDPQEYDGSGLSLEAGAVAGTRDSLCPWVGNGDSDGDGIQDGDVVRKTVEGVVTAFGLALAYTHYEDFLDIEDAGIPHPGVLRIVPSEATGEQQDDALWNVCDADSDGDGLGDGEEISLGSDPGDWDTDNDGRNDWHEVTGGGPVPTDPFDPDTDDDGLLDSAEVFGLNSTNPANPDTDGDGLCDGGTGTPWMLSGDARIAISLVCKSCNAPLADVGLDACAVAVRSGSSDGIGDHPNPHGYGEDKNGNGQWEPGGGDYWGDVYAGDETDPNQFDTDGDGDGDGIEVLGFSTSRQGWIPPADQYGRPIDVTYPACGCLNPLDPDTDDDQLEDGYEDRNHDGNFDFLPSEFDYYDPLPGPPIPYPTETNPCDLDTDHDGLTDYEERYQAQVFALYADWDNDGDGLYNEDPYRDGIDEDLDGLDGEDPIEPPFNPTNPLDHDTDNDWILDGPEVMWKCVEMAYFTLDNDTDGLTDEDPVDEIDNDGDGLIDEDPIDYWVRFIPMLDPTNRDSDSDGYIDGLDDDPCNSDLIPLLAPVTGLPIDTDGDGFSDEDETYAGTHPNDPEDHPAAYAAMNMDLDECFDDRLWLEPAACCGIANSVVIDIDSNLLADIRVQIVQPYDVSIGDFDGDGFEDDAQYVVEYAFALYRAVQRRMTATITDLHMDLVIDTVELERH